ncbi:MAG: (Fe-S)-binding protein [Candidatus Desantisbacteria bacterium]
MEAIQPKKVSDEIKELLKNVDFNTCLTCGTCAGGCPVSGISGDLEGWDIRKVLRMLVYGMVNEVVDSKFPWVCTGCGRCIHACPMKIDIVYLMKIMKKLRDRDKVPGVLHKGVIKVLETGNNMGIPEKIYKDVLELVEEELQEEDGFSDFKLPIDKDNVDVAFYPNSKEISSDSDDMKWYWKIFHVAKAEWTIPKDNWEAVDWGIFTANDEASMTLAKRKIDFVKAHNIKRLILPDCGGGSFGARSGIEKWKAKDPSMAIDYLYIYDIFIEYMKEGRIKVDKSKNTKIHTWHDSCKHGREAERVFGQGKYDEPRWLLQQCTDNFVEMHPTDSNAFCCGAGGGAWAGPYKEERNYYGLRKAESIKNSEAEVVVVGCSNCRDQILRGLKPKYNLNIEVKYIWQIIADSLIIE